MGDSIPQGDIVTITVGKVTLNPNTPCLDKHDIEKLYVAYRFLDIPLNETETPYSLPKPEHNKSLTFDFKKVTHVDYKNNYERRQHLASMLLPDHPENGRIRFTLVSEPFDELDECDDVGVAFVSIREILESGHDLIEQPIPLYYIKDEVTEIGCMTVTVQCVEVMKIIQHEIAESVD